MWNPVDNKSVTAANMLRSEWGFIITCHWKGNVTCFERKNEKISRKWNRYNEDRISKMWREIRVSEFCSTRSQFVALTTKLICITEHNYVIHWMWTALLWIENTRVGTLIVATIYLQLIQNRYMFRSFTVLQCSHQHFVQPVASDVEVVGYLYQRLLCW